MQLGCHLVAVLEYTFTHRQYKEQHNRTTQITTNGVVFYNTSQLSKNGICMLQLKLNK